MKQSTLIAALAAASMAGTAGAQSITYEQIRLNAMVAADGTPSLVMSDDAGRARLRLTVTGEGHGAIEFLDEDGEVIHTFAPGAEG